MSELFLSKFPVKVNSEGNPGLMNPENYPLLPVYQLYAFEIIKLLTS